MAKIKKWEYRLRGKGYYYCRLMCDMNTHDTVCMERGGCAVCEYHAKVMLPNKETYAHPIHLEGNQWCTCDACIAKFAVCPSSPTGKHDFVGGAYTHKHCQYCLTIYDSLTHGRCVALGLSDDHIAWDEDVRAQINAEIAFYKNEQAPKEIKFMNAITGERIGA